MERINALQQTFAEVDPTPLAKWVEDFKRDVDPERELRIYEAMAQAYRAYCQGKNLSAPPSLMSTKWSSSGQVHQTPRFSHD